MQDIVFSSSVTLEFSREFPVSREEFWIALTDGGEISAWIGYPCTFELAPGGLFTIGVDDQIGLAVICYYVENSMLITLYRETMVFQVIESRGEDACVYRVRQIGVMPEAAPSFAAGWHHTLDKLSSYFAEEEPELSDDEIETRYEEQFRAYAQTHGMMRPT